MKRSFKVGLAIVLVPVLGFFSLLGYAKYKSSSITLSPLTPGGNSVVLAIDGKPLGHIASAQVGKELTDAQITTLVRQTHMAAEDRGFYGHGAISLPGLATALAKDAIGLSVRAGGSTITQQLAKKYVGSEKSLQRKIDELPYAYKLEHDYSKDQILDMYVNANYYGRGAYGIEDAAQTWFGISATRLSNMNDPLDVARAAFLAALIQQPSAFDDYKGRPSNLVYASAVWARTRYVLNGLRDLRNILPANMVSQQVVDAAKQRLPLTLTNTVKNSGNSVDGDPFVMRYVHDWMVAWQTEVAKSLDPTLSDDAAAKAGQSAAEGLLARGGLKIQTHIDSNIQNLTVNAHREELGGGPSGVIVLDPRNGGVLAMSGGRNYSVDPNNYAMYASRPPGSTMKPFVLADAISHGISVKSVFAAPRYFPGDGPPIWDHTRADAAGCKLTLADALAVSNNVVYSEAITGKMASCQDRAHTTRIDGYSVNPGEVADLLRKAGADASPVPGRTSPAKLSAETRLAIGGTIELSPLKLAVMSATLDGGVYHKPHLIDGIDGPNGVKLFQYDDDSRRVLDEKYTRIVDQAMTGVFTNGTAIYDQVEGHPLAGKTGTTDANQGDSWFFAFNANNPKYKNEPALDCAGWAGENPTRQGADVGKVCQNVFSHALRGRQTVPFPDADMNAGKLVGLNVAQPPPPPPPTHVVPRRPAPAPTTVRPTPTPPVTVSAPPSASPTPTNSVPPPEQSGGPASGSAPPPGSPPPPPTGTDQTAAVVTPSKSPKIP